MIFSFSELKKFYKKISLLGRTVKFSDFKNENVFLIRHDVDFDLNKAYTIAELEKEEGIVSTFFVLVRNDNYNILSPQSQKILNSIQDLGHEIGLHFDASLYDDNFEFHAKKEASILQSIIKKEIKSIALHNPSVKNIYPEFSSFNDAYSNVFFNEKYYLSDACFDFRGKDCFEFIELIKFSFLQINLHPIHYSVEGEKNYVPIMNKIYYEKLKETDSIMKENKTYKENRKSVGYSIKIL